MEIKHLHLHYLYKQKQADKRESENIKYNCDQHYYSYDQELVQAHRFCNDLYNEILSPTVLFPHAYAE